MSLDMQLDRLWHIGLVRAPITAFLQPGFRPTIEWLPRPGYGEFLADPFGITEGELLHVFAEAYDYSTRRGRIVSTRFDGTSWTPYRDAFAPGYHVSFPCLFEVAGLRYCIPEQWQAGAVAIHALDLAGGRLGPEVARIADFPGVDPVCFEHAGRHWVFATDHRSESADALHAFHAPSCLGPYVPHARNPLAVGRTGVRNAGHVFLQDGKLYRPTQDGRRRYGHAVEIMQITELSQTSFAQEPRARIEPWDERYSLGFHTLASAPGVTLVDGLRPTLVPAAARRLVSRIRRR